MTNPNKTTVTITGKTYPAASLLRECGFEWHAADKYWYGSQDALDELNRVSTASYSRANAKLVAGLTIETI